MCLNFINPLFTVVCNWRWVQIINRSGKVVLGP